MERARMTTQIGQGVLAAPVTQVLQHLAEWDRRRQMRKSFGLTSEVLLRDIGLTPDDLIAALAQPLEDTASNALVRAAVARAGNW